MSSADPVPAGLPEEQARLRVILPGGTTTETVTGHGIRRVDRDMDGEAGRREWSVRLELGRRQVLLGLREVAADLYGAGQSSYEAA